MNLIIKFFLSFEEDTYQINIENDLSLIDDLEFILNNENLFLDKITDFSKSNITGISTNNNSAEIARRFYTIDPDNLHKLKELDKFSQPKCEEIIEFFDIEFYKMIEKDPILKEMNELPFMEKNKDKRFCNFCLVKKVLFTLYIILFTNNFGNFEF